LALIEAIVDRSGVTGGLEALMSSGGRPRQLRIRTLLIGILSAAADGRPAHLRRIHAALIALEVADQIRLEVIADTRRGPHRLTYRQVEHTVATLTRVAGNALQAAINALIEASFPPEWAKKSTSYAVDWTDLDSWAHAPAKGQSAADPDAAWGHRRGHGPGQRDELFFGFYLSAATLVADESGPEVPELIRRIALGSCALDPVPHMADVIENMAASGVEVGDILADSGYAHRVPNKWAARLRAIGAKIITDLHPADRGPRGTHGGAICANGNLYCPATPAALLAIEPLARGADPDATAAHDRTTAELARYKLGRASTDRPDGSHRVACPATLGKLRCPLKPASITVGLDRPEIAETPDHPPRCCQQQTITVGADVLAKTAQKHDYPSAAHRRSYRRRTAVERSFSTLKDPASTDIRRGYIRLMGQAKNLLLVAGAIIVRNLRILSAFAARAANDHHRAATGKPPRPPRQRATT
jgi:hypothetical protein